MKKILGIIALVIFSINQVYALDSSGVIYDNSGSGQAPTNVNDALNDLYSKLNQKQDEINNINNIGNAASNHILSGYTAYVKGKTVTGSIPNKGATTYTPGTTNQTIGVGSYISGVQTIKGDANLISANIAKGKSIFGVNGTYTSDANATASNILSGKTAYVKGSKITGAIPNRSAVSGGAEGVVGLNSDIWKNVAVSPFDGALHWLTNTDGVKRLCLQAPYGVYGGKNNPGGLNGDGYVGIEVSRFGNAQASQVLNTATFTSQNGMSMTGTIPSKGATTYTPGVSNQTIASGQYLSGVQTIKGDANLVASNIKKGVSIFGISGTYGGNNAVSILESNGWGSTTRASGLAYAYSVKSGSNITISGTFSGILSSRYNMGCSTNYSIDNSPFGTDIGYENNPLDYVSVSGSSKKVNCVFKGITPGVGLVSIGYQNTTGSDTVNYHWNYALVVVYP